MIDIQGHRGCRGLMPENTLSAFQKALELGVNTLELDVVITKDSQVLVSHEPWFNYEITTLPNGKTLTDDEGHLLNIFKMKYPEILQYDVGKKTHPRFLNQVKQKEHKPLLAELVSLVEEFCQKNNPCNVQYNLEIKSTIDDENNGYQPSVPVFCELVMDAIKKGSIEKKCTIQSFDIRVLEYLHIHYPKQQLCYLVENNSNYKEALQQLSFTPAIYSCDFQFVTKQMIEGLHKRAIKVIPWTVNEDADIKEMLNLGVDGIISDYPNKVMEICEESF